MSAPPTYTEKETKGNQTQQSDLQSLQIKMADLIEQNHKLTQEVENLKNQTSEDSNIVKFKQA